MASLPGFRASYLGSLVFSPDDAFLACASAESGPRVLVNDVKRRQVSRELEPEGPWFGGVAFSPNGKTMAVSGGPYEILLYDFETWGLKRRLQGHLNEAWPLAFSPDGRHLVSGSKDATVRVWDPNAIKPAATIDLRVAVAPAAGTLSTDGDKLCVLATDDTLWDLQRGFLIKEFSGALNSYNCLAIPKDGRRVFASGRPGVLSVWDTGSLQSVGTFDSHREITGAAMSRLAILSGSDTVVAVGGDARGTVLRLYRTPPWTEIEAAGKADQKVR